MMHGRTGALFVAFAIFVFIPGLSLAQTVGPCRDDIQRLCKDMGSFGVAGCLHQHASELSPACQARLAEVKQRVQQRRSQLKQACQGDIDKFCSKVQPGNLRLAKCLREHKEQISTGCKAALAERPAHNGGTPAAPPATPHH